MSKQQDFLMQACAHLGLDIALGYNLTLPPGRRVAATAYISGIGGEKGLLIFSSADQLCGAHSEIVSAGFCYTIYREPGPSEQFDLQSYRETFIDWGYSDPQSQPSDPPEEL